MPPDPPSFQGFLLFVTGTPDRELNRQTDTKNENVYWTYTEFSGAIHGEQKSFTNMILNILL